jgi:hypothetical protein
MMHGINFDKKVAKNKARLNETIKRRLKVSSHLTNIMVKEELNKINEELLNIQRELARKQLLHDKQSCTFKKEKTHSNINNVLKVDASSQAQSNENELGTDFLKLITTIKQVIKVHQYEEPKFDLSFIFCAGLNEKNSEISKKNHQESIDKANFKLINTLEKLKRKVDKPVQKLTSKNYACSSKSSEAICKSEKYLTLLKDYSDQLRMRLTEKETNAHSKVVHTEKIETNIENTCERSYVYEWKYLAIVLDRILFFIFALVIPICLLIMSLKL